MSWFGFDAASIAARAAQAPGKPVPTLRDSVLRGTVGFTAVSVAGFIPWAVFARPLHHYVGEAGMYIACAAV
ncbi:MAG TPA: hypothetical protein VF607_08930, partial [Verrucomicrobiae bacterium]